MSFERFRPAKYEFPIDDVAPRAKSDAPAGVYLLAGRWQLAAHDSEAEARLIGAGALLVATLTFSLPVRPFDVATLPALAVMQQFPANAC
jgi:hypothetical protein